MKKMILLFASAALTAAVSCDNTKMVYEEPGDMGRLSVEISLQGCSATRSAFTSETTEEKKITDIQLLIFHEDGSLAHYEDMGTETSAKDISLTRGDKTVWVVANADDLSYVMSLAYLEAMDIELEEYNDPDSGFVRAGSGTVTVGTNSSINIVISRFVSRIVLNRVTNDLPSSAGALTIDNAFISNVVGNQILSGWSEEPYLWYNQMGRETDAVSSSAIIDGIDYEASAPDLTFLSIYSSVKYGSSLSGVPYLYYSYPNSTEDDETGWTHEFTPRKTRLVVTASFDGNRYYYPVTISGRTERNNTYTVEMTITGPGSDDPDKPIVKDSFTATVTVQSWLGTTIYTETI